MLIIAIKSVQPWTLCKFRKRLQHTWELSSRDGGCPFFFFLLKIYPMPNDFVSRVYGFKISSWLNNMPRLWSPITFFSLEKVVWKPEDYNKKKMSITKTKQNKVERNEYSIKGTKKKLDGSVGKVIYHQTGWSQVNSQKTHRRRGNQLLQVVLWPPPTSRGNPAHKPWQPRPHTCRDVNKKRTDSLNGPK